MKKYIVEFFYQDRNARGFHLKHSKRTLKAKSAEEAVKKIEQALSTTLITPTISEIAE